MFSNFTTLFYENSIIVGIYTLYILTKEVIMNIILKVASLMLLLFSFQNSFSMDDLRKDKESLISPEQGGLLLSELKEGDTLFIYYDASGCHSSTIIEIQITKRKKGLKWSKRYYFWTYEGTKKSYKKSKMKKKHLEAFQAFEESTLKPSSSVDPNEGIHTYARSSGYLAMGKDKRIFYNTMDFYALERVLENKKKR